MSKSFSPRPESEQASKIADLKPPAGSAADDSAGKTSIKTVGVYERPERTGGTSKALMVGITVLIIVVILALIFFVF